MVQSLKILEERSCLALIHRCLHARWLVVALFRKMVLVALIRQVVVQVEGLIHRMDLQGSKQVVGLFRMRLAMVHSSRKDLLVAGKDVALILGEVEWAVGLRLPENLGLQILGFQFVSFEELDIYRVPQCLMGVESWELLIQVLARKEVDIPELASILV